MTNVWLGNKLVHPETTLLELPADRSHRASQTRLWTAFLDGDPILYRTVAQIFHPITKSISLESSRKQAQEALASFNVDSIHLPSKNTTTKYIAKTKSHRALPYPYKETKDKSFFPPPKNISAPKEPSKSFHWNRNEFLFSMHWLLGCNPLQDVQTLHSCSSCACYLHHRSAWNYLSTH
jgi:hypothetical protein